MQKSADFKTSTYYHQFYTEMHDNVSNTVTGAQSFKMQQNVSFKNNFTYLYHNMDNIINF